MSESIAVFEALKKFINQDAGLERGNYDSWQSYFREANAIKRDGTNARKALREAMQYPFDAEKLADAFKSAFSGRLEWNGKELEYTPGQYYPTEYRKAAYAVLAQYIHAVKPKFVPETGTIFYTAADIERAADRAGSHFFDRDTKRFFRSRILPDAFHGQGGCYFVTSEQFEDHTGHRAKRKYTIRKFNPIDASIDSFGPFNVLSRSRALRIAKIASEYPEAALEAMKFDKEAWQS